MAETFVHYASSQPRVFFAQVAVALGGVAYSWWQQFISSPLNALTGVGGIIALWLLIRGRYLHNKLIAAQLKQVEAQTKKIEASK